MKLSKAYQSRSKNKQAGRGFIKNRISIDERPVIVERTTSFSVSTRINDKSAKTVTEATIALLMPFKDAVHTITADNGKEFAYHEAVAAKINRLQKSLALRSHKCND
jgi:IS30 family transposase